MSNFISLHNQTTYSLLDSLCSVPDLFKKAKELSQTAIAITDHGSIASAWEALNISKSSGIKLIIGCESYFTDDAQNIEPKLRHLILLAKNAVGYRNLLTLNKKSFDQGKVAGNKNYPILDWNLLEQYKEGLICLTACGNGIISQLLSTGNFEKAEEALVKLKELFADDLGIEILANNMKRGATPYFDEIDQSFLNRKLIKLAEKYEVKVVATCNTHYINKEDYETHDVLLAVGSKQPIYSNFRLKYNVNDFYLKSEDEIVNFFKRNFGEQKAKEFVCNSKYFADLCEFPDWIDPKYSNPSGKELPVFPVKDEVDYPEFSSWLNNQDYLVKQLLEDKQYLRYKCFLGLKTYSDKMNFSEERLKIYSDRIDEELDVLEFHGFSSYILIVNDYLNWCKKNNISTGPGRGSIGGSLIAYLIGIHEADPIQYNLIFARFHNKDKQSYPDIDCDIAPSGREKLQNYLKNKYGENNVAHVSNLNRITPKVYIKDIARSCELGGSKEEAVKIGNAVADCVPAEIKSIDEAYNKIPLFAEFCKKYPEFIKFKAICNQGRANSTHAGGLIISERPMTGLVPLRKDKDGALSVEYDKDKAEENGLVKMDILGLSTLDIISKANELIVLNAKEVPVIDYNIYDEKSYDLLSKGDTFCVFQLGTSGGTIDLCKRIKPKSIEEISHINALARPSARDMRDGFIKAKDGKSKVILLHPKLKRAFGGTFGFGLYEESLMFLAQDVANWSLHEADKLRKLTKAKGKYPEKVAKWRQEFIDGAVKNDVSEVIATRIWDETISGFGGYGFNSSHSILYSMISYKTAYYKAHFPVEFLLANLMFEVKSNSPTAKANIEKIKNEIKARKVKILPPNINESQLTYTMLDDKTLLTGLDALKFVGDEAIVDMISKRPFTSFQDFMSRVSSKLVRANTVQALAASGALDCFCTNNIRRKDIFLYVSDYRKKLTAWKKKHSDNETFNYGWVKDQDWTIEQKYALEVHYLNEGFICKPHKAYNNFFDGEQVLYCHIKKSPNKSYLSPIKGIVVDFFAFTIKKEGSKFYGQQMCKIMIEDKTGERYSCTIFPDRWETIKDKIKENERHSGIKEFGVGLAISFEGSTNLYDDNIGIIFNKLFDLRPTPAKPQDLKPLKSSTRTKEEKIENVKDIVDTDILDKDISSKIEDFLYEEGVLELNN